MAARGALIVFVIVIVTSFSALILFLSKTQVQLTRRKKYVET